ncbi:MAG: fluoride efflux transporter CrcB [Gammaproteobacteria bacterium]|nr:fluoride efflux transporter CrcB [Gammaproteobacteria bacterium]
MLQFLLVVAGGAIGAASRFVVYNLSMRWLSLSFPSATLIVNVSGSFIGGLLVAWISHHSRLSSELRAFLLVGILGAFTTFSTFSLDTIKLLQQQHFVSAGLNVVLNLILSLAAVYVGMLVVE